MKRVTRICVGKNIVATHEGLLQIPLAKGMKFQFDHPDQPVRKVVSWSYFEDPQADESGLLIELDEFRELGSDNAVFLMLGCAVLSFLVCGAIAWTWYLNPQSMKADLGYLFQPAVIGTSAFFVLMAISGYIRRSLFPASPFWRNYLSALAATVGIFGGILLRQSLAPAVPLLYPEGYAAYFDSSLATLQSGWKTFGVIGSFLAALFANSDAIGKALAVLGLGKRG